MWCEWGGHTLSRSGCAFWEREPGSDDEPDWVPAGVVAPIRPPVSPRQAAAAVT